MGSEMVRAEEIEQGEWFIKKNGHYAYMRMSESSVRFLGLDPDKVYGICFTGNVCVVRKGTLVEPATVKDHIANLAAGTTWHKMVGCKEMSDHDIDGIYACSACRRTERNVVCCPQCGKEMDRICDANPPQKRKRTTTITIVEDIR